MSAIAVIDIGKTNAKLTLVDANTGNVLANESRETHTLDGPPYPHLDTEGLWLWYLAELRRAQQVAPIDTICVTTHGASAALVDDTELVLPVMDYEYAGPDAIAPEYDARCDPFTHTYSPKLPHGMNIGRQIYWQRANYPDEFARARYLLTYPQYWTWRLTGNAACEVTSIGAHSDLWHPEGGVLSNFARREGFDRLIPQRQRADAILGTLQSQWCEETGISPRCQVLVGIHDSNASLVPYLKTRQPPFTVVSTGTWVISFAVGAPLASLVAQRDCIANVNLYGEPVACTRYMGGREFAIVAGDTITPGTVEDLECIIDEGHFVMPGFTPIGGPYQTLSGHIDAHRTLTAQERTVLAGLYCALVTDVSLNYAGSMGDVFVEGAYAKNPLLMQILDTLREQQPVFGSTDNTGTTIGTAMLAIDHIKPPTLHPTPALPFGLRDKILNYRQQWQTRVDQHEQAALAQVS